MRGVRFTFPNALRKILFPKEARTLEDAWRVHAAAAAAAAASMHMMQMHWALKRDPTSTKPRTKRRPLEHAIAAGTYDPFVKNQRHLRKSLGKPPPTMIVFKSPSRDATVSSPHLAAAISPASPPSPPSPPSPTSPEPSKPDLQDAVDLLSLAAPSMPAKLSKAAQRPHPYARPTPAPVARPPSPTESPEILFNEEMIREMSALAHSATAAGSLAALCMSHASPPHASTPKGEGCVAFAPVRGAAPESHLSDVLTQRPSADSSVKTPEPFVPVDLVATPPAPVASRLLAFD